MRQLGKPFLVRTNLTADGGLSRGGSSKVVIDMEADAFFSVLLPSGQPIKLDANAMGYRWVPFRELWDGMLRDGMAAIWGACARTHAREHVRGCIVNPKWAAVIDAGVRRFVSTIR